MLRKSRRQLLEEAERAHSNATKKASRLRRLKGVEIGGTSADPRRDLEDVRSMSAANLRRHVEQLQKFNSRSTQFVQGADQTVITASLWKEHEKLREQWNARVREHEAKIADVFVKSKNATVAQEDAKTKSNEGSLQRAGGERSSRPFTERKRKPENIRGDEAMKKINAEMRERLKPGYFNKRIKAQREIHKKMMLESGDTEAIAKADKLTNQQFNIFWNYAGGAQESAVKYGISKMRSDGDEHEERWWQGVIEDSNRESNELLEEARQYPSQNPENRPRRRRR